MILLYSIKDINRVINFGSRINSKLEEYGQEKFDNWCGYTYGYSTKHLDPFMLIAKCESRARQIFKKQPLLSVNGLARTLQNEISGN